jgi:hypothetical protein
MVTRTTKIVGVHGIGSLDLDRTPDDAATDLARIWLKALRHNLPGDLIDLRVAYYADLLQHDDRRRDDVESVETKAWADALEAPDDIAQGYVTLPQRLFVAWLAQRRGLDSTLVQRLVRTFLREVDQYLREPASPTRIAVRGRVEQAIETHAPSLVIAHSLGSVVAYEALLARPDLKVDTLLTVGSPLALNGIVYQRLPADHGGEPRRLPNVRKWINVADVGDIVAVPRSIRDRFAVYPEIRENIGLTSMHDVVDYLRSRTVGGIVAAAG